MQTSLLSIALKNFKNATNKVNVFTFLIIFFMTISSYGQSDGITFNCDGNIVEFGVPDGTDQAGNLYWNNGSFGFSLYVEIDPVEGPVWALHANGNGILYPDPSHSPGELYFYSIIADNPSLCGASWIYSFASCNELIVNCPGGPDPDPDSDNDGVADAFDCDPLDDTVTTSSADDSDNDGVNDCDDQELNSPCPSDVDADGISNDDDGDNIPNCDDVCPGSDDTADNDNDAIPDGCDDDDDNDGVLDTEDCLPFDDRAYPGATEVPGDLIDNDCDGEVDEDDDQVDMYQYCNAKKTKVLICHNGKDKCVSINAVDAHLNHGDILGSCTNTRSGSNEGTIVDNQDINEVNPTTVDVVSWPNPSSNLFNVKMITPNIEDKVEFQLFDINGRLIHSDVIKGNENYQFGNNLSHGVYFVKISQAFNSKVLKVIKR